MQLQPGTYLQGDKYRIIDTLGRGGFGITYLAEQVLAKRKVCIKEFFPKDYYTRDAEATEITLASPSFAEMMNKFKDKFIKEAQTIARLEHPNIIHIHDVFEENGTAYYVMEYIDGESLSDVVKRRGALPEAEAVKYIRSVADALGYIHERKIMHLDIKPANVMLRKEDGRAILIDFGLSKQYDAEGNQTSSTPVGISAGYAPMEQYQQGGVKEFSPETDIYSLGATLYYLVTGNVPPQAATIADYGLPELPSHLSSGVRNAIERSMEIPRRRRPHSIKEFLALLGSKPEPKRKRRWWLWLLLALVVVAVGVIALGGGDKEGDTSDTPAMEQPSISAHNGHEYVDLGLSVKWATCNVGADSPEDYGKYYAWGETSPKSSYTEDNCKTYNKNIGDIAGNATYDAARANWGGNWRMPTDAEFEELLDKNNCTWTWTTQNGKNGYKVTSNKNGNSIFLPAAGYRNGTDTYNDGSIGYFWSSTPYSYAQSASALDFYEDYHDTHWYHRLVGKSVRPVLE